MSQPERVALYARVSGDRQEKEGTIETQLAKLYERVQADRLVVCAEYLDNPYTGTVANRPALDRLMDDARKKLFARVLIYHPDRLARGKPWLRPYLEEQLQRAGVTVSYLNYEVEDSPEGRAKDGMLTVFAEWEREHSQQRLRDGKQVKLSRGGNWHSNRAYGYRYVKPAVKGKDGHFEIVEEERPIVRFIFDSVLRGMSLRAVAAELIQQGVSTIRSGTWNDTRVRNVIHNPIYTGKAAYHRKERVEPKERRVAYPTRRSSERLRPREEWLYTPAPAIVTEEEQTRAIAILTSNRVLSKRNAKHDYLLSGLLYCGYPHRDTEEPCGRRMHGERVKISYYYRCSRVYVGASGMRSPHCRGYCPADVVESIVWERLTTLLRDPATLLLQMEAARAESADLRRQAGDDVERAGRLLDDIQTKLDRLLDMHLAGTVDTTTYQRKEAALVRERETAQEILQAGQDRARASGALAARWDDVEAYCRLVSERLTELEQPEHFARRQELVRTLIHRIVLYPDTVVIEGVLPCVDGTSGNGLSARRHDAMQIIQFEGYAFALTAPLPPVRRGPRPSTCRV